MNMVDVILAKRDGGRLSDEQIDWFIRAYTDGQVPDEQASALLMVPYVVTIIVVAGLVGRSRAPAADGKPYVKE